MSIKNNKIILLIIISWFSFDKAFALDSDREGVCPFHEYSFSLETLAINASFIAVLKLNEMPTYFYRPIGQNGSSDQSTIRTLSIENIYKDDGASSSPRKVGDLVYLYSKGGQLPVSSTGEVGKFDNLSPFNVINIGERILLFGNPAGDFPAPASHAKTFSYLSNTMDTNLNKNILIEQKIIPDSYVPNLYQSVSDAFGVYSIDRNSGLLNSTLSSSSSCYSIFQEHLQRSIIGKSLDEIVATLGQLPQ